MGKKEDEAADSYRKNLLENGIPVKSKRKLLELFRERAEAGTNPVFDLVQPEAVLCGTFFIEGDRKHGLMIFADHETARLVRQLVLWESWADGNEKSRKDLLALAKSIDETCPPVWTNAKVDYAHGQEFDKEKNAWVLRRFEAEGQVFDGIWAVVQHQEKARRKHAERMGLEGEDAMVVQRSWMVVHEPTKSRVSSGIKTAKDAKSLVVKIAEPPYPWRVILDREGWEEAIADIEQIVRAHFGLTPKEMAKRERESEKKRKARIAKHEAQVKARKAARAKRTRGET